MDPEALLTTANGAIAVLAPVLAKVISSASKSVSGAGKDLAQAVGEAAGEKVAGLLKTITSKFKDSPAGREAMDDFVKNPKDKDAQAALRQQLKKAIQKDKKFAEALKKRLADKELQAMQSGIMASGNRSIASGQVERSTIISGDVEGNITINQ